MVMSRFISSLIFTLTGRSLNLGLLRLGLRHSWDLWFHWLLRFLGWIHERILVDRVLRTLPLMVVEGIGCPAEEIRHDYEMISCTFDKYREYRRYV
jgi:hypothetical protein